MHSVVPARRHDIKVGPLDRVIGKRIKKALIVLASMVALLVIAFIGVPNFRAFFILQATGIARAGTWEDDSKNWYRAFNAELPADVEVIHSKYVRPRAQQALMVRARFGLPRLIAP